MAARFDAPRPDTDGSKHLLHRVRLHQHVCRCDQERKCRCCFYGSSRLSWTGAEQILGHVTLIQNHPL